MRCHLFLLTIGCIAGLAVPAPAGIFFGKHPKPTPAERVSQLVMQLRTDPDESKRANAAKELRAFDPRAFPQIVPTLIDVLKRDQKPAVRLEAAQTLSKLRPISQEAGLALEEAVGDPSWRVRWQARQALLGYRMSGYRSPPDNLGPSIKQDAHQAPSVSPVKRSLLPRAKTGPTIVPNETPPPPLADPTPSPPVTGPLLQSSSTLTPVELPKLQKPPSVGQPFQADSEGPK
jgi:hypothetical protein